MFKYWLHFTLIVPLLLLLSCAQPAPEAAEEEVTAVPIPTIAETSPPLIIEPTADAPPPPPTAVPAEAEPSAPPPTVPPPPEEAEESLIDGAAITAPIVDSSLIAGETIALQGTAGAGNIDLTLRISIGEYLLLETTTTADAAGVWSSAVQLPPQAAGPAWIQAFSDAGLLATQPVHIVFAADDPAWITTAAPAVDATAAAGYTFFFQGQANAPIDGTITIGILRDNCTELVARQPFAMPGGSWYGQLIPPATEPAGTACAIAYSGDFPDGVWRGVITPIQIQAYEDPAPLLFLGSPDPLGFRAGGSVTLFGTAVNAAENSVTLQILDAAGAEIASGTAVADTFGYWETELAIPADAAPGLAELVIGAVSAADDTPVLLQGTIEIGP